MKGTSQKVAIFNTVGGEGYKLSDIKPIYDASESEEVGGGSIQLMTLKKDKTTLQNYWWLTDDGCGVEDEDGWYDNDGGYGENSEYEFDPGEGFRLTSSDGVMPFMFSGEVKYPVVITFEKGTSICGNFHPQTMKLSQIKPIYDPSQAEEVGGGSIQLMRLKQDKTTLQNYWWLTDDGCGVQDEDGWYDNDGGYGENAEYEFATSEGFFVTTSDTAMDFSFPELSLSK